MATINHEHAPVGEIHKFINWEFDTVDELQSYLNITALDFHKAAYVAEVQGYYAPIAVDAGSGEVTWIAVGGSGASSNTNLTSVPSTTTVTITSSTGTDAVIAAASDTLAGLMLPAQVTKLAAVPLNTDLSYSATPVQGIVLSSSGTDATIPAATGVNAGLLLPGDFTKLGGINVGTAGPDVPNNAQLNVRLGTTGNLGTAAQRNIGTASANVPDVTQLNTRLGTSGNLGTMAQQNATAVTVTGGTVGGLSSLGVNGNLTFSGTSRRILGDFSNATLANRLMVQTSTPGGSTTLALIPDAAGEACGFQVYATATVTDSPRIQFNCSPTAAVVASSNANGAGLFLPLGLQTGGSTRVLLNTTGELGIGLTADTSCNLQVNNGIKLGNTNNANANVLDWYEEGTFTPVATGATVAGVATYTGQSGRYTRVGNTVFFTIDLRWSAHTGSGSFIVSGLPFTAGAAPVCAFVFFYNGLAPGAGREVTATMPSGTSSFIVRYSDPTGAAGQVPLPAVLTSLTICGNYFV
jgi:hypothetical protein